MSAYALGLLMLVASTAFALRCHVVNSGNLSNPAPSNPEECPFGGLTCVKIVDYNRNLYTKQCQAANCTSLGTVNAPANCFNTSNLGITQATCCCYGDGCNSAPTTSILAVVSALAFSSLLIF